MTLHKVILYTLTMTLTVVGGDWAANCSASCKCVWFKGKKTAECIDQRMTAVPGTLSPELQIIQLNENNLQTLPPATFKQVGLVNLHKIFLQKCKIKVVDKEAFTGLKVLIELDLSHNEIHTLHKDLFRECEKIREIILSHNPIKQLENDLFSDLRFLQKVDLSNCKLYKIGIRTFSSLPNFSNLELKGNQLVHLDLDAVIHLSKLQNLGLNDNPWRCDCNLTEFRDWVVEKKLYSIPTNCNEPKRLKDKLWSDVQSEEFACTPVIKMPETDMSIEVKSYNMTLLCQAQGSPIPDVHWLYNSRMVSNHSMTGSGDKQFILHETRSYDSKLVQLTLIHARARDSGEYKCVAKNPGGEVDRKVQVSVDSAPLENSFFGPSSTIFDLWGLIVGLVCGALLLLIVLSIVVCCYCRKEKRKKERETKHIKENVNGGVGEMRDSEQAKELLIVNPVQKPPRRQDQSVSNSETDLQDFSARFTDNGSIIGNGNLESESSIRSYATLPRYSESAEEENSRCPPDLLSFPPKVDQQDEGSKRPQKLFNTSQFGTLPYSRSHSPFSPPLVSRPAGPSSYVTIPRKPKNGTWNATLSPVVMSPHEDTALNPIYDNLGPRTTADGSSVLSLNKCDTPTQQFMRHRPLPATPSNDLFCEPIAEHPALRHSWSRTPPEGSHKPFEETEKLLSNSKYVTVKNKIPPNPPPKPKKKVSKSLFEDEGEDGTEV